MIELYTKWVNKYPIVSIEDGLDQDDWEGYVKFTKALGDKIQIVGDDLFVTNTKRLEKGIAMGACNSILIKLNQIGTVTETIETIEMAKKANYTAVVSHRSGETEDTFIADLTVAPRDRPDQDRLHVAHRPHLQVQPAHADRGRDGRHRGILGEEGVLLRSKVSPRLYREPALMGLDEGLPEGLRRRLYAGAIYPIVRHEAELAPAGGLISTPRSRIAVTMALAKAAWFPLDPYLEEDHIDVHGPDVNRDAGNRREEPCEESGILVVLAEALRHLVEGYESRSGENARLAQTAAHDLALFSRCRDEIARTRKDGAHGCAEALGEAEHHRVGALGHLRRPTPRVAAALKSRAPSRWMGRP